MSVQPRASENQHDYAAILPAKQDDMEISTISKAYTNSYFAVSVSSPSSELNSVRVWTERKGNQRKWGEQLFHDAFNWHKCGTDIDSAEYMDKTYDISGTWSPY